MQVKRTKDGSKPSTTKQKPVAQSKAKEAAPTIKQREKRTEPARGLLPSGSTLLNCALADSPDAGIGAGKIINIVGDSSAGKTMVIETMFAEMSNDPRYDDYELILDDSEHAMEMDIAGLFGKKTAKRVKAPRYIDGEATHSDTVEQFYATIMGLIRSGKKFVYGLDSLDTLTDVSEYEQAEALADKAEKTGHEDVSMAGTYGMTKAKLLSQVLRTIKAGLAKTGSTLIVISQTRDNVNVRPGMPTKKRSGGKALDFYCTHIVWLTPIATLKAGKKGREEIIGREVEAKVTKNKLTGKVRTVSFPIRYDYGVDDTMSCVDFLAEYDVFKKAGGRIDATRLGFDASMFRSDLVKAIEDGGKIPELRKLVGETWLEKEELLTDADRKPRFA